MRVQYLITEYTHHNSSVAPTCPNHLHFASHDFISKHSHLRCDSGVVIPGPRNFFPTLVLGSGNFQLSRLAGLGNGLGLGFWVVITIIVSLTLTLTLITTLTVILL